MTFARFVAIGSTIALAAPALAAAQCPDGSPPPCVAARPAAQRSALPAAAERARRFLVLPFRNLTRAADQEWLVEGSTTMLSDALARWQGITVVSDEKLYPALKRAGVSPGTVADAQRVRRVAEETGGWTAVSGEVLATGGRVRITARAWDVVSDREIVRAASEVPAGGDVRAAFDSVSLRLLRSVGIESVTADLANTTTRDLDAYRAYVRGLTHTRRTEPKLAIQAFEEAVRRDSAFALAWMRLADAVSAAEPASVFNPASRVAQYSQRAVAHSAQLPPRQRALVLASNAQLRMQFSETRRLLETLLKEDSTDVEALMMLAGLEMFDPVLVPVPGGFRPRGSPAAAARAARQAVQLDPSRYVMYGALAQMYAQAGVPQPQQVIAFTREPTSMQDLLQMGQQRALVRVYLPVLRDSIILVPAESLATIPPDSLASTRRSARSISRQWAERWLQAAPGEAAPHQLLSSLYALDGEYVAALRELNAADSIGVQTPAWAPAARRLVFLSKAGDYAQAARIADSIAATPFFANPNMSITNADAAIWAFAHLVARGRVAAASTLLAQQQVVRRAINPNVPSPELVAISILIGNFREKDEPHIPQTFRGRQLDTLLARLADFASVEPIASHLPLLLDFIAAAADTTRRRLRDVFPAADALAKSGKPRLAFEIASNVITNDSTLESVAAAYPWYRSANEALSAARLKTQARFHGGSATISADRIVLEWRVDDSTRFVRYGAELPVNRAEYRFDVIIEGASRYYRFTAAAAPKPVGAAPFSATLAEILPPSAGRQVVGGNIRNGIQADTTVLQNVVLRTEFAPGILRFVVSDPAMIEVLRRERPAQARFRFYPCAVTVGVVGASRCVDERIPVTYTP